LNQDHGRKKEKDKKKKETIGGLAPFHRGEEECKRKEKKIESQTLNFEDKADMKLVGGKKKRKRRGKKEKPASVEFTWTTLKARPGEFYERPSKGTPGGEKPTSKEQKERRKGLVEGHGEPVVVTRRESRWAIPEPLTPQDKY